MCGAQMDVGAKGRSAGGRRRRLPLRQGLCDQMGCAAGRRRPRLKGRPVSFSRPHFLFPASFSFPMIHLSPFSFVCLSLPPLPPSSFPLFLLRRTHRRASPRLGSYHCASPGPVMSMPGACANSENRKGENAGPRSEKWL